MVAQTRPRNGTRATKILDAAGDLFHRSGYHSVGMDDIGEAVGVTGPAIYSHFPSKAGLLAALMERIADDMLDFDRVVADTDGPAEALRRLVVNQVDFVLRNRAVITVWIRETRSLSPADRRRLRARQRVYVGRWADKLLELNPEMDPAEALLLVHGVINFIASIAFHDPKLNDSRVLRDVLERNAIGLLLGPPTGDVG